MRSFDDFHRVVQAAIASKRLGTPVFVRYSVQGPVAAKAVPGFLAQLSHAVSSWLGQDIHRIYALGSVKGRHVTLTLDCRDGASAQLTWTGVPARGPGVDLMLIGNRGVLYHDVGAGNSWEGFPELPAGAATKEMIGWVERALRTGQPELASK